MSITLLPERDLVLLQPLIAGEVSQHKDLIPFAGTVAAFVVAPEKIDAERMIEYFKRKVSPRYFAEYLRRYPDMKRLFEGEVPRDRIFPEATILPNLLERKLFLYAWIFFAFKNLAFGLLGNIDAEHEAFLSRVPSLAFVARGNKGFHCHHFVFGHHDWFRQLHDERNDGLLLLDPKAVITRLQSHGYKIAQKPRVGQVVVYYSKDKVHHYARVVKVEGDEITVESKWGESPIFRHSAFVLDYCYGDMMVLLDPPSLIPDEEFVRISVLWSVASVIHPYFACMIRDFVALGDYLPIQRLMPLPVIALFKRKLSEDPTAVKWLKRCQSEEELSAYMEEAPLAVQRSANAHPLSHNAERRLLAVAEAYFSYHHRNVHPSLIPGYLQLLDRVESVRCLPAEGSRNASEFAFRRHHWYQSGAAVAERFLWDTPRGVALFLACRGYTTARTLEAGQVVIYHTNTEVKHYGRVVRVDTPRPGKKEVIVASHWGVDGRIREHRAGVVRMPYGHSMTAMNPPKKDTSALLPEEDLPLLQPMVVAEVATTIFRRFARMIGDFTTSSEKVESRRMLTYFQRSIPFEFVEYVKDKKMSWGAKTSLEYGSLEQRVISYARIFFDFKETEFIMKGKLHEHSGADFDQYHLFIERVLGITRIPIEGGKCCNFVFKDCAWFRGMPSNHLLRNVRDTTQFLASKGYRVANAPRVGQIVMYVSLNMVVHYAKVVEINGEGVFVESKWGRAPAFRHPIGLGAPDYAQSDHVFLDPPMA